MSPIFATLATVALLSSPTQAQQPGSIQYQEHQRLEQRQQEQQGQQEQQEQQQQEAPAPPLQTTRICVTLSSDIQSGSFNIQTFAEEANRIWRPYGIQVVGFDKPCAMPTAGPTVRVTLRDRLSRARAKTLPVNALGSIDFISGVPKPEIDLWVDEAVRMLGGGGSLLTSSNTDPRLRVHLGRLLGRSLAHELGHYLLSTRLHTTTGLMRARYPQDEITRMNTDLFALDPDQVAALRRTLASWRTELETNTASLNP
jgi:hypothetical protein